MLDESQEPRFLIHLDEVAGGGAPDFDSFLRALDRLKVLSRKTPCYVVLDLTSAQPDAQKRQQLVVWLRTHGTEIRHQIRAIAFVAPSTLLRGALTAVRWFMSDRVLMSEVFETRADALVWVERCQKVAPR